MKLDGARHRTHRGACARQLQQPDRRLKRAQLGGGGPRDDPSVGRTNERGDVGRAVEHDAHDQAKGEEAQRGGLRREKDGTSPPGRRETSLGLGSAPAAKLRAAAVLAERQQAEPAERVPAPAVHVVASRTALLRCMADGARREETAGEAREEA